MNGEDWRCVELAMDQLSVDGRSMMCSRGESLRARLSALAFAMVAPAAAFSSKRLSHRNIDPRINSYKSPG